MRAFRSPRARALAIAFVALLLGLAAHVAPVVAQGTLRYITNDEGVILIDSPMGAMEVVAEQYGDVSFAISGTEMVATYDSLVSYVGGTNGDQSPDVAPLLNGSFELVFERPGVVVTRRHPEMDVGTAAGLDPLHLFDDFFVPLPADGLAVGREWTETLVHEGSSQPDATFFSERVMTMKVERDTLVNGAAAFVVSVSQEITQESTGFVPGQGFAFASLLDGTETGVVILTGDGTMLSRSRTIEMDGLFTIDVQGQTFDMPQTVSFTGTADLVAGG
jgi:hypothetical protein